MLYSIGTRGGASLRLQMFRWLSAKTCGLRRPRIAEKSFTCTTVRVKSTRQPTPLPRITCNNIAAHLLVHPHIPKVAIRDAHMQALSCDNVQDNTILSRQSIIPTYGQHFIWLVCRVMTKEYIPEHWPLKTRQPSPLILFYPPKESKLPVPAPCLRGLSTGSLMRAALHICVLQCGDVCVLYYRPRDHLWPPLQDQRTVIVHASPPTAMP
jgi:hypothetical protein